MSGINTARTCFSTLGRVKVVEGAKNQIRKWPLITCPSGDTVGRAALAVSAVLTLLLAVVLEVLKG